MYMPTGVVNTPSDLPLTGTTDGTSAPSAVPTKKNTKKKGTVKSSAKTAVLSAIAAIPNKKARAAAKKSYAAANLTRRAIKANNELSLKLASLKGAAMQAYTLWYQEFINGEAASVTLKPSAGTKSGSPKST
jgi:hypothetical protein